MAIKPLVPDDSFHEDHLSSEKHQQNTTTNEPTSSDSSTRYKFVNNPALIINLSSDGTACSSFNVKMPDVTLSEALTTNIAVDHIIKANDSKIRVNEAKAKNIDKVETKQKMIALEEAHVERCDVKHPRIYCDESGNIFYQLNDGSGIKKLHPLMDVFSFSSKLFIHNSYEGNFRILAVIWRPKEKPDEIRSIFYSFDENFDAYFFLKELYKNGLMLLTSRRMKEEVSKAFISYCIENSEIIELPYSFGWNQMSDNSWFFAHEETLTIMSLLETAKYNNSRRIRK